MIEKIVKAITEVLKKEFKTIYIYSTDIDAGYNLPCFFIKTNSVKTEKLTSKIDTLYINLDILYACKDEKNNQKECFIMTEKLRNLLLEKPIKVDNNISFQIYEDSIDIGDDYLSVNFDIEMNLIKDTEEDLDYMQDLSIK